MKKTITILGMLLSANISYAVDLNSLSAIKEQCNQSIVAILPDNLLKHSKCTCNKLDTSDQEKLKKIDNEMAELSKLLQSFQTGDVAIYPAGFDPDYEKTRLLNDYMNVFIIRAKQCEAGL